MPARRTLVTVTLLGLLTASAITQAAPRRPSVVRKLSPLARVQRKVKGFVRGPWTFFRTAKVAGLATTASGVGMMVTGALKRDPHLVQSGMQLGAVGASVFVLGHGMKKVGDLPDYYE